MRWIPLWLVLGLVVSPLWAATTTDEAIRKYRLLLLHFPADYTLHTKLASVYILKARETGDLVYYDRAEQALRRSLDLRTEGNYQAYTYLAAIFQAKHDFDKAVTAAKRAGAMAPTDSYAYGLLGDAYQEQGKYDRAGWAYEKMHRLVPSLFSHARLARFHWLHGDTEGALRHLRLAVERGLTRSRSNENIAWAQTQLGEFHFSQGALPEAEAHHRAALSTYPGYHVATVGLAEVLAAQGHDQKAVKLYHDALQTIELPHYAAALGNLYRKLGRVDEAEQQYQRVEQLTSGTTLNEVLYNRMLAYFYAAHDRNVENALVLARKELEQRNDIYTYDVLAWALYKNGQVHEALPAMAEALKLGTKDARLFFHAGMIHSYLGQAEQSKSYLTRALVTNPYFDSLQADVANATIRQLDSGTGESFAP